jgi:hypothetical protein
VSISTFPSPRRGVHGPVPPHPGPAGDRRGSDSPPGGYRGIIPLSLPPSCHGRA